MCGAWCCAKFDALSSYEHPEPGCVGCLRNELSDPEECQRAVTAKAPVSDKSPSAESGAVLRHFVGTYRSAVAAYDARAGTVGGWQGGWTASKNSRNTTRTLLAINRNRSASRARLARVIPTEKPRTVGSTPSPESPERDPPPSAATSPRWSGWADPPIRPQAQDPRSGERHT